MSLFGEISSWPLFGLGVLLLTFILLRRSLRYQRKRGGRQGGTKGGQDNPARSETALSNAPPEILRWQVEMHETARDLMAQLDSKMSALQALLMMAQQEAERLDEAIQQAASRSADPLEQLELSSAEMPSLVGPPQHRSGAAVEQLPGTDQERSSIYTLADLGHSPTRIADQIGVSVGDVELILGCRASNSS